MIKKLVLYLTFINLLVGMGTLTIKAASYFTTLNMKSLEQCPKKKKIIVEDSEGNTIVYVHSASFTLSNGSNFNYEHLNSSILSGEAIVKTTFNQNYKISDQTITIALYDKLQIDELTSKLIEAKVDYDQCDEDMGEGKILYLIKLNSSNIEINITNN